VTPQFESPELNVEEWIAPLAEVALPSIASTTTTGINRAFTDFRKCRTYPAGR